MTRFAKPLFLLFFLSFVMADALFAAPKNRLPYFSDPTFTPVWSAAKKRHTIKPFTLKDQSGNPITEKDLAGKIVVANFFFPACHGICPTTMKNLKKVQDAFKKDKTVLLLSHSLTTETDTPELLQSYAKEHGVVSPQWRLLTGARKALFTHARQSFFADEDLGRKTAEEAFLHTEMFFLVDGKGHIRGLYPGTRPADVATLIEDIKLLKSSKNS